ncbi:TRAP transporter small permease subunit [Hasllibacter sp. MH4015]|uniref:TRAP transporter small permease subunit n=1 Tax=Hasllibacter sp. MH4015 TaxID=2854029 RepID=UPI001CD808FA|nr:TRAP transporter small permease [Hasllibacter sp. MH4015]
MAQTSNVLTDDGTASRLDRALLWLEARLNLLGGATILALVVLAVVHVVGRKLFNAPVYGYVDWIQQFMVVFAFFGLSYCQREGGHIRMDILVMRMKGRVLWLAEWLSTLFMLILTIGLIYGAWQHFDRSFDLSRPLWSRDSSIDIALPLWPAKLIVPVSFGILTLRLIIQLIIYSRALVTGQERPAGVPLPEDPMAIAAREAETVSGREGGQ